MKVAVPVYNDKEAKDAKKDEPEPEEDVNFLVDDVEREQTQCVMFLHFA